MSDIVDDDPEREIYITADHGMLAKTAAIDPGRVLTEDGIPASAIPIIKDRYVAHHGNLGGAAYVFLKNLADTPEAIHKLLSYAGHRRGIRSGRCSIHVSAASRTDRGHLCISG